MNVSRSHFFCHLTTVKRRSLLFFSFITAGPVYPDPVQTDDASQLNKSEVTESPLLQKVYVHTSIVPSDHIVPDKEDDGFTDNRRDNNPLAGHPQNAMTRQNSAPNLEQQVLNALKQFVAKSKNNSGNAPPIGVGGGGGNNNMVTGNRVIRRRRIPLTGNRNGRMF